MPPSSSGAGRRPSPWALILLLALLQSVTPLSVDLYLPALPTIARALRHTGRLVRPAPMGAGPLKELS